VDNVGWGKACEVQLYVSGDHLHPLQPKQLADLGRHNHDAGEIAIVPKIAGDITVTVTLCWRHADEEARRETITQTVSVARSDDVLERLAAEGRAVNITVGTMVSGQGKMLEIKESSVINRGTLWDESGSPESNPYDTGAFSTANVRRQVADSRTLENEPPAFDQIEAFVCPNPACGRPLTGYLLQEPDAGFCPICGTALNRDPKSHSQS
jgi:hypothetical protein